MKRNILIIEDNEIHMRMLRNIVEDLHEDISAYYACNMEQAYNIAMVEHIHLFLVDIILDMKKAGDASGLEFADMIRTVERYRFTPLIFITSLEDPKLYSYSQLHCFDYIEKPFDSGKVRTVILNALEFPVKDEADRQVYFRKDRIVYSVSVNSVEYVDIQRRKATIRCIKDTNHGIEEDTLEVPHVTTDEIIRMLDSEFFIQCSRHTIINRRYIEYIDYTNRFIKMRYEDKPIDIGASMKKKLKDLLDDR